MTAAKRHEWKGSMVVHGRGSRFRGWGEVLLLVGREGDGRISFLVRKLVRKRAGTAPLEAVSKAFPTPEGCEIQFADGVRIELLGSSAMSVALAIQAARPSAGNTLGMLSDLAVELLRAVEDELDEG